MSIKINIPQFLESLDSEATLTDVKGGTVGECLHEMVKQFPAMSELLFDANGELLKSIEVFVNGESAYPEELNRPVKNGDELYIMTVIAGG